ncbi:hypothetical protein ABE438_14705 [Bosea sp. TWI1241]|uniref:hypothetical protein n=1 Tax=Bosea sp. TWI1241 TaxID=3148904 RepID=UPI0032086BD5
MGWGDIDFASVRAAIDGFGGLKTISDALGIVKQIKELTGKNKDGQAADLPTPEMRQLVIDLTNKMIDAREETATLRLRMLEALEELGRLQAFECDRQKYDLVETNPGSFAYKAKSPARGDHQAIRYCAHCFEQSKRLVTLQLSKQDWHRDTLKCSACQSEIFQKNDLKPEVFVAQGPHFSPFE